MKKLSLALLAVFFLPISLIVAQEMPIYDQYHFNYYLINPAVAGADKCSHLMLTTKNNWIGMDGPSTQALSFRTRITGKNIGLGGYIYNDKTPNFRYVGGQATFAYHIPMSDGARYLRDVKLDRQLSFGVSVKANNHAFEAVEGTLNENIDPANTSFSELSLNANVGVYYIDYGFFAGLSATNLIPYDLDNYGRQEPSNPLTAFLFVGYGFDLGDGNEIEPSVNFNYDANDNKQLELNLKYSSNNEVDDLGYWAQLSYRHNMDDGGGKALSIIPIVGVRINKFQLAYAFNWTLNELANHNYGTHELMLAYSFCVPKKFCR
ncbi:MAG: type IX secretion system membrane protein PorP/SprF [Prevotellaceae bacterium]|jgi:type IX secretion system PorP/SprF family membrane protein|nr:type IX secretion system membrane protein PorP/SprF [Prevotellaceae bacterium]